LLVVVAWVGFGWAPKVVFAEDGANAKSVD
jgi:hypothetical protein